MADVKSRDPKPSGGREEENDPKPSGPKGGPGFGAGAGTAGASFAGGCGWVVVAFIGPAGVSVPEMASRILQGQGASSSASSSPFAELAAKAQAEARRQQADRQLCASTQRLYDNLRKADERAAGSGKPAKPPSR